MVSSPGSVLSASSRGFETFCSTVSGSAPRRIVVTVMVGNSTSGNWSTPIRGHETAPKTTTASSSMLVKSGRLMKVRIGLTGTSRWRALLGDADGGSVGEAGGPLDDDQLVGADPGADPDLAGVEPLDLDPAAAELVPLDREDERVRALAVDRVGRQEEPHHGALGAERQLGDRAGEIGRASCR